MALPSDGGYKRSRKEALVAGIIWLAAGLWTVPVSYWLGSQRPIETLVGIPTWVIWGVLAPWVFFFCVHIWYSLIFIRDDEAEPRD